MHLEVPLDLTLKTFPAKVWVEERPYHEDSVQAAICRRLGKPAVEKVLRWEKSGKERRTKAEEVVEAVGAAVENELSLPEFISRFGNFFPGSEITAAQARKVIAAVGMFIALAGTLKKRPPAAAYIESWLLKPLRRFVEGVPEVERLAAALQEGEGLVLGDRQGVKSVTLLYLPEGWSTPVWGAAKRGSWPVFKVPPTWPDTREEIAAYIRQELLRNSVARLQRVRPRWTCSGKLKLEPACLADALVAVLILGNFVLSNKAEMRPKTLATEDRRAVENYFYVYYRRGKITREQYRLAVAAVKEAWEIGERDRATLREMGWEAVGRVLRSDCNLDCNLTAI